MHYVGCGGPARGGIWGSNARLDLGVQCEVGFGIQREVGFDRSRSGRANLRTADESQLAASVLHHVLPDWPDSVVVKFLEVAPDFRAFGAQGDVTQLKVLGQKDRPLFYQAG